MLFKVLTSLMLFIQLTTLTNGLQGDGQCGGIQSIVPFVDILAGMDYYSRCSFQTDKLNSSCILASCPLLKGVCPLKSTCALNNAVSILTSCLGQKGLMCGMDMSHTPIVQMALTTAQFIPSSMANGTVVLNPGTGYISNLNQAKFTAIQNEPITLAIEANDIISQIDCNCNFTLPLSSAARSLPFVHPSFSFLNTPHMHGVYHLNLSSSVAIDLSTCPPTTNTLDDRFSMISAFTNFTTLNGLPLYPPVVHMFNTGMGMLLKQSAIPSTALNFLATYAALALQGSQEGCS